MVFALVLVTMMIPFQALLTPLFLEMHSLGLTNNLAGLALFYTTFNLPFGVFVMRNTFLQIPWELSEAAAVDGASAARTLVSVLRPLIVPGIATTVLYAFLFSWTEFVGALTFITSNNLFTLPLALLNMEYGSVGPGELRLPGSGCGDRERATRLCCTSAAATLLHPRPDVPGVVRRASRGRAIIRATAFAATAAELPTVQAGITEAKSTQRGGRGRQGNGIAVRRLRLAYG